MHEITLIFPDQLFLEHPCLASDRPVCLVEEFLLFKVQPFHKQRLVLLKAALRSYADKLVKLGKEVIYIPSKELPRRGAFLERLAKASVKTIHLAEFADEWLHEDLKRGAEKYGWKIAFYPSPGYICSEGEVRSFFAGKEHFSMAQFYAYQRKAQDILMEGSTPVGGKYSFDVENRKKLPKNTYVPPTFVPRQSAAVEKIIKEVEEEFPDAIGAAAPFLYPTTHEEAHRALDLFLERKLALFGDYQDAIQKEDSFLFHSVLSPLLNTGLLTPSEVIQKALDNAIRGEVPLNSLEGFLRQIMGWREFVRTSYLLKGSFQRSFNFFHHHEKLPNSFWEGSTGILPIDTLVKRVRRTGYCNHIERLMVLGNFLLLTETAPSEIYRWFMAGFIDAYDWVMVPNIYGMSQFADGGTMVTKPYVSSSNYLLKMSNYPKGEWCDIWDGLFWRFLEKHRPLFSSNYRTANMVKILDKNSAGILPKIQKAEEWLVDYRAGTLLKY